LITDRKIQGKVEGDFLFIKNKDGFEKIEEDNHEYIEFLVENTDLFRLSQDGNVEAEQGASPDRK
jgi:hypothetical protein